MTIIEVAPIFVLIAGALFMYKVYLHGKMKTSNKLNKPSFLLRRYAAWVCAEGLLP
ncbi:hypothetical protein [Paraflavitalea speifideaquila]|uniref:hypothetical protein n=1 Tax=Paraflavitalea speifideaquila TaxID=3076558 RepID=UPI0028E86C0C|nr:hypothetical protein [Paraflavitalea speifideiaquila]